MTRIDYPKLAVWLGALSFSLACWALLIKLVARAVSAS